MTPYIIGIDPGKSLGIAVMDFPRLIDAYQGEVENGIVYLKDMLKAATDLRPNNVYVAIEKYMMTPGSGRKRGGGKITALVQRCEDIANEYPVKGVYMQSVADASRFSNDLLRRLNLYVSASRVGHRDANDANSAVRHIMLFMARNRADLLTEIMKGVDII